MERTSQEDFLGNSLAVLAAEVRAGAGPPLHDHASDQGKQSQYKIMFGDSHVPKSPTWSVVTAAEPCSRSLTHRSYTRRDQDGIKARKVGKQPTELPQIVIAGVKAQRGHISTPVMRSDVRAKPTMVGCR